MNLFFVHGANATPGSFNYLTSKLGLSRDRMAFADYSSNDGFYNNLDQMKSQLIDGDWFLISHSMGGIYSAHLCEFLGNRFMGAVSMSTPYGGSELCDVLSLVHPFSRLFRDASTRSRPIKEAQQKIATISPTPWTAIATSSGRVPYLPDHNDGVVTLSSQLALEKYMDIIQLDCNHYEIMQDDRMVNIIQDQIRRL